MIKRTDILEGDTETDDGAAALEAARAEELAALKAKAHSDELARVRAEAELEATRKMTPNVQPQVQTWTEDQWKQAEESSGMTRQQLMTANAIAEERARASTKAIEDRLKAAEERAARAEEKANKFEYSRGFESQVNKFIDSKPALRPYKDDVDSFLGKFPEADRKDPAKLKDLLSDAEIFIRGKVGSKMRSNGSGSSPKLGGGNDFDESESGQSLDLSGLDDKHQRRVIEDIWDETKGHDTKELEKLLSSDKTTIRISAEEEWKVKK